MNRAGKRPMKLSPRRVARIRNELRAWLRTRHGIRRGYVREQIDLGREELGFRSTDDALIAYTFFGPDLLPGIAGEPEFLLSEHDITALAELSLDGDLDLSQLFVDD